MAITTTEPALLRLLQLSSAALPVGAYAFSQGMETAVEKGWLKSADDVRQWLSPQLEYSLARVDIPLLQRQLCSARLGDRAQLLYWNEFTLACRESGEMRLADTAMGEALVRLLSQLEVPMPSPAIVEPSFLTAFALAAAHWQLDTRTACLGYIWGWLENQVAAAVKLVPLGQGAAQVLLGELMELVPACLDRGEDLPDEEIGAALPGLALASAWHETQYSRLFRS
jgi:urease accessory protein